VRVKAIVPHIFRACRKLANSWTQRIPAAGRILAPQLSQAIGGKEPVEFRPIVTPSMYLLSADCADFTDSFSLFFCFSASVSFAHSEDTTRSGRSSGCCHQPPTIREPFHYLQENSGCGDPPSIYASHIPSTSAFICQTENALPRKSLSPMPQVNCSQ